jgi:hypothetical protein
MLEQLACATLDARRILLGCRPEAISLAASKRATADLLRERGIGVVPTYALPDPIPPLPDVRQVRLTDAGVRLARQRAATATRRLPRSLERDSIASSATLRLGAEGSMM